MHISGEKICLGDILTIGRAENRLKADVERGGSLTVGAVAVCTRADLDFTLQAKNAIKKSKLQVALEDKQDMAKLKIFGTLELDSESLCRVL